MAIDLAKKYVAQGMPIIPVPYKTKAPNIPNWPNLVITHDNLDQYFGQKPQNISVLLGKKGSDLYDIDLDCPEAKIFAEKFLPKTGFRYGRKSNPLSHWVYRIPDGGKNTRYEHPEHGVLLEIRGEGLTSVLPGSMHPDEELYEFVDDGKPASTGFETLDYAASLVAICCLMTKFWPVKGMRHQAALGAAGFLLKAGYEEERVVTAVYEVAKTACDEEADDRRKAALDTVEKHNAGSSVTGITALKDIFPQSVIKCLAKWSDTSSEGEVTELVEQINQKHAFIIIGGTQKILSFNNHPITGKKYIKFMKIDAFKGLYKNQVLYMGQGKNGPIEKTLADIWMSHPARLTYEDMVFEPNQDVPKRVFNYWQGYAVDPVEDNALCEVFLHHLFAVVCNENEDHFDWLVSWLAHMVQHPDKKPGTAVVLIGPQGAGKTCVGEFIGEIFQPHFLKLNNPKHLLGNFNAHQDGIVFALCEEAFLAGDKVAQGVLKDMITSDTMMIERKGVDPIQSRNCLHLFLTSNNPWVVSAGIDDRRFFVLEVSGKYANDYEYFSKFKECQKNGGPAALLHFLLHYDYSQVALHKPPHTKALAAQKLETLDPIGKVIYKFLLEGHIHSKSKEWPEWIETEQMYEICFSGTKKVGSADKGLQTKLGMLLRNYLGPIKKEKKYLPAVNIETGESHPIKFGSNKIQQKIYVLPSLEECRLRFTDRTGIDFPDEIEE